VQQQKAEVRVFDDIAPMDAVSAYVMIGVEIGESRLVVAVVVVEVVAQQQGVEAIEESLEIELQ
jgi:hypothetical protein